MRLRLFYIIFLGLVGCASTVDSTPFTRMINDMVKEAPRFSFFSKDRRKFTIYYYDCGVRVHGKAEGKEKGSETDSETGTPETSD